MLWTSGNLWRLGLVWQQCNLAVCVTLFWSPARAECVGVSLCLNIIEPSTLEYRNPKPQILQRREPHHQDSIWCRLLSFECQSRQALHPARVSSAMNTKITQAEWVNACFFNFQYPLVIDQNFPKHPTQEIPHVSVSIFSGQMSVEVKIFHPAIESQYKQPWTCDNFHVSELDQKMAYVWKCVKLVGSSATISRFLTNILTWSFPLASARASVGAVGSLYPSTPLYQSIPTMRMPVPLLKKQMTSSAT